MDSEWTDDGEKRDREFRDKKLKGEDLRCPRRSTELRRGRRQGHAWGKVMGEDTMSFDTQESKGDDEHSCENGPDCKFRGKVEGGNKRKSKPDQPPKKKKAKKVALPPKRLRSTSPPNAKSSLRVKRSPQESSTREELKGECKCDEERTLLPGACETRDDSS
jgi:hypothetical protein